MNAPSSKLARAAWLGLFALTALGLAACTVEGVGKDVEHVGEEIQEEAEGHD
jgi:predicted small secreted protein